MIPSGVAQRGSDAPVTGSSPPGALALPPAPTLDPTQQAVVDHPGGPLLVLAGPGTGKTTTIVEAVAARIDAGVDPEQILVLTFSRKAAAELRTRITGRVARPSASRWPAPSTPTPTACSAAALLAATPPRLLTSAEQDAVVASCCAATPRRRARSAGRRSWRRRSATAGFRTELRELLMRATERGVDSARLAAWGRESGREHWVHAAAFQEQYEASRPSPPPAGATPPATTRRSSCGQAIAELDGDPELLRQERERARWLFVDEYQDTDPAQVELLELLAGGGGNLVAVGDPDQAIYAFRGAEPRGIVEFPDRFRHTDGRARPAGSRSASAGGRARSCCGSAGRSPRGCPGRGSTAGWHRSRAPTPAPPRCTSSAPRRWRRPTSPTSCAGPTCSTACPGREMAVVVRTAGALGPLRRAVLRRGPGRGVRRRPAARRAAGRRRRCSARSPRSCRRPAPGPRPRAGGRAGRAGRRGAAASPLGGATVLDLRRLRRAVRIALAKRGIDAAERGAPLATALGRRGAPRLAARARRRPARRVAASSPPAGWRWPTTAPPRTCCGPCGSAAAWPPVGQGSARGGPSGAVADRDLDAVVALFDAAAGFVDRLPSADVRAFVAHLSAQELPGDTGAAPPPAGGRRSGC